jgi:hypothetical protein
MNVQIAGRAMPQKRIGRCVGIGLVVVACPVALATPRTGKIANGFRVFSRPEGSDRLQGMRTIFPAV